jgi:hypothetical protein
MKMLKLLIFMLLLAVPQVSRAQVSGTVDGLTVTIHKASIDSTQRHVFLKFQVTDGDKIVYSREVEYARNTGETLPEFVLRIISTEKLSRDAAIKSYKVKLNTATDFSSTLTAITAP